MITTTVRFYNVGLSEKNLPYNYAALLNILAAGEIKSSGQGYVLHLSALPFGAVFNISQEVYAVVKSATYLKITNVDLEDPNATPDVRFAFINNFLQIANGNFSVAYTIDDWTSFYLYPESPYNIHIDGLIERANVPLIRDEDVFTVFGQGLNGKIKNVAKTETKNVNLTRGGWHGWALPDGYKCAVYFITDPKYNGTASDAGYNAHGTLLDFDVKTGNYRSLPRNNSCIYYMVFDPNGYNLGVYSKFGANDAYIEIIPPRIYTIDDANDSTIDKIMYFDFIPTDDPQRWDNGFQPIIYNGTAVFGIVAAGGTIDNDLKQVLADIINVNNVYGKALRIRAFAPVLESAANPFALICNGTTITRPTSAIGAFVNSLYRNIDEFRAIRVKYLTAELEIPSYLLFTDTKFYVCFSGDAETVVLKMYSNTLAQYASYKISQTNIESATGQNTNYFDLTLVRDFKAYKNAKITGAAGIAATAVGSVTALGTSIASGNVAGIVGALSGGAQGIISGIQKLQGLTPSKQSPASGDKTLNDITNDGDNILYCQISYSELDDAIIHDFEENGVAVNVAFIDYYSLCQMQAFNALKMAVIDVTGAPQQITRRIEETFLNGVTLWTATDVGNKRVVNYPL